MLSELTLGLLKSSLKQFLDIEPVILDSIAAQAVARLHGMRDILNNGFTGLSARMDGFHNAVHAVVTSAGNALRIGAEA